MLLPPFSHWAAHGPRVHYLIAGRAARLRLHSGWPRSRHPAPSPVPRGKVRRSISPMPAYTLARPCTHLSLALPAPSHAAPCWLLSHSPVVCPACAPSPAILAILQGPFDAIAADIGLAVALQLSRRFSCPLLSHAHQARHSHPLTACPFPLLLPPLPLQRKPSPSSPSSTASCTRKRSLQPAPLPRRRLLQQPALPQPSPPQQQLLPPPPPPLPPPRLRHLLSRQTRRQAPRLLPQAGCRVQPTRRLPCLPCSQPSTAYSRALRVPFCVPRLSRPLAQLPDAYSRAPGQSDAMLSRRA